MVVIAFDLQGTLVCNGKLITGAKELLSRLSVNHTLCLVSYGRKIDDLNLFLETLGIFEFFSLIVHLSSDSFYQNYSKENGSIYRYLVDYFSVPKGDFFVIGDRIDHDVIGARIAGVRFLLVDFTDRYSFFGISTISSFDDIESIFCEVSKNV